MFLREMPMKCGQKEGEVIVRQGDSSQSHKVKRCWFWERLPLLGGAGSFYVRMDAVEIMQKVMRT